MAVTQTLIDDLHRCDAPADEARCLPPLTYTAGELQEIENKAIFLKGWIPIGRADRVPDAGSFEAIELAGRSIFLVRDKQGVLHAHANTCRHRGARLVEGSGSLTGIRCPFHAWLYRLDGTLAAAPQLDTSADFQKCDHNLISYPIAERLGFAFVSFDPDPPTIDDWLGDFADIHADWPLDQLVSTRHWTRDFNCNWKAFIDVFNEYYHLPYVHRDSIDAIYAKPDAPDEVAGNFATQFGKTAGTGGLLVHQQAHELPAMPGLSDRAKTGARYTWVFPSMTFAASAEGMWVYQAIPIKPGVCRVTQTMCFHKNTKDLEDFDAKAQEYYHRLDTALDEDIPALENQHAGLMTPDARPGPFEPELEPSVAAFARWYAKKLLKELDP